MKTFEVRALATISLVTRVEAETEDEAREIVTQRDMPQLCHQCASGSGKDEHWVTSGELDGEPHNIEIEVSK